MGSAASSSSAELGDKKVVVVGGGYVGVMVAQFVDKIANVTLISRQEVLVHNVAGLRATVRPAAIKSILIPLGGALKRGKLVVGEAARIDERASEVHMASGDRVPYDYLIMATGSLSDGVFGRGGKAITVAELEKVFAERAKAVKAAKRILIIGGGATGLEMAGEIATELRADNKTITLITSKDLMDDGRSPFTAKMKTKLKAKLASKGVTVHTHAGRVDIKPEDIDAFSLIQGIRTYTAGNVSVEADLAIVCTGGRSRNNLARTSGWEARLDTEDLYKVDQYMRVEGAGGKIFALGDCSNLSESKTAFFGGMQAKWLAKNLPVLAKEGNTSAAPAKVKPYPLHPKGMALVSLGYNDGVADFGGMVMSGFMPAKMKSGDLFTTQNWAQLNAGKPPAAPRPQ